MLIMRVEKLLVEDEAYEEELMATSKELIATNKELIATSKELIVTSKELIATNEELMMEIKASVAELTQVSFDVVCEYMF